MYTQNPIGIVAKQILEGGKIKGKKSDYFFFKFFKERKKGDDTEQNNLEKNAIWTKVFLVE